MIDLEFLLYRILSGKLEYGSSFILEPNLQIKYKGRKIFHYVISNCFDTVSDADVYKLLIQTNQWSAEKEREFKGIPDKIKNLKVEYYQSYKNIKFRKEKLFQINYYEGLYEKYFLERNVYFNLTPEGIAHGAMWFEMIQYMYKGSDKLAALNYYNTNRILENTIRDIAQCHEWLTYVGASKNPFGKPAVRMTDDQRRLAVWTAIYRNSKSHPDCPSDAIFKDHHAFDGWSIAQERKTQSEKNNKEQVGKIRKDATSVFLPPSSKDEVDEILGLNDKDAMFKMKSMFKQIDEEKHVREKDFKYRKINK